MSDPFTLVQSAENMVKFNKEIQIEAHSVVFQFTPMSKCTKRTKETFIIQKFSFKNVLSVTIEYRIYLKFTHRYLAALTQRVLRISSDGDDPRNFWGFEIFDFEILGFF